MRPNSLIMFVLALVFGALAVFAANRWLQSQNAEVVVSPNPAQTTTATIVVAANPLKFGTPLQRLDLKEIPWDSASVPDGAFRKIDDLFANNDRRVVLTPMSVNETILKWKISGPDARASLSAIVTEGMRAASIRVNDVVGVGGFVLPGDRVDVLFTRTDDEEHRGSDILIQNVRVLAVDQLADENSTSPTVGKTVTVEVTAMDAQKLALASSIGMLSLSLRAAGSLDAAVARKVVAEELTSSPSVYQAEQNALAGRLQGLEETIASLEGKLKEAYQNAGQGDAALRAKLSEVETNLRNALANTSKEDPALKQKLAALEDSLRKLGNKPPQVIIAEPLASTDDGLRTVLVVRGTKPENYQVPAEAFEQVEQIE